MASQLVEIIGYVNGNGYFPSFLVVILKSKAGITYKLWPGLYIAKESNWEQYFSNNSWGLLPESQRFSVSIDVENPDDTTACIAFSRTENPADIRLLRPRDMYVFLQELLLEKLTEQEREIISDCVTSFWEH